MTKVVEHLSKNQNKTLFSFEILPPIKGEGISNLFQAIEPLMDFDPKFIDVTYHRQEYVYRNRPGGLLEKVPVRKRPGTVGICAAIMNRFHVDTVPHIICGGFTKEETENALIDLDFLGIDNVLALRGDAIKSEKSFHPTQGGHAYATELIEQVTALNKGNYLDPDIQSASPTQFCVGVAGYPEKHFEAPNLNTDLKYLKQKVDLGAEYIVTQMFFDNQKFFDFVDECRAIGINVPIIPGLKPLAVKSQLTVLPSIFHIDLPDELIAQVDKCKNNQEVKEIGTKWCIEQSLELKKKGVPCLHYYSMGKSQQVQQIAKAVF